MDTIRKVLFDEHCYFLLRALRSWNWEPLMIEPQSKFKPAMIHLVRLGYVECVNNQYRVTENYKEQLHAFYKEISNEQLNDTPTVHIRGSFSLNYYSDGSYDVPPSEKTGEGWEDDRPFD